MTNEELYTIDNTPFRVKLDEPEPLPHGNRLREWNALKLNIDRQKTIGDIQYDDSILVEDLSHGSNEKVWAVCIQCGKGRLVIYKAYYHLCRSCSLSGKKHPMFGRTGEKSPLFGKHHSEEFRKKVSKATSGKKNGMFGKKHAEETRIKMSCTKQGITAEEFDGFISFGKYCSRFNESLKERIREKYNRTCVLCPTTEQEHVDKWGEKLPVHHIDYNKQCGCDGNECRLVPLCKKCHGKTNSRRAYWEQVIMMKVLEMFPDINFDSPQTTLEDFCTTQSEHHNKISNLVKSIVEQCVTYPPDPSTTKQSSLLNF